MADELINTRITADISNAEQGINKVKRSFQDLSTESQTTSNAMKGHLAYSTMAMTELEKAIQGVTMRTMYLGMAAGFIAAPFIAVGVAVKSAIEAIDNLKVSTIQVAASIATMQGPKNVEENYKAASIYAGALAVKLQEVDANSFANYQTLLAMVQTMTTQGVVLDINKKKQVDAFTALSNAVAMYTAGQNQAIQAHQEIRALMSGEVREGAVLAKQINDMAKASGLYKNGLKDIVEEGKKHGDLLERLAPFLVGINVASSDINKTWMAVTSSLQTAIGMVQRAGFDTLFKDAVQWGGQLVTYLKDHAEIIGGSIKTGWEDVKKVSSSMSIVLVGVGILLKDTIIPLLQSAWSITTLTAQAITEIPAALKEAPGVVTALGIAAYYAIGGIAGITLAYESFTGVIAASMASNPIGWAAAVMGAFYLAAKPVVKMLDELLFKYTGLNLTGEAFYKSEMNHAAAAAKAWDDAKAKAKWMYEEGGITPSATMKKALGIVDVPVIPKKPGKPPEGSEEALDKLVESQHRWTLEALKAGKATNELASYMDVLDEKKKKDFENNLLASGWSKALVNQAVEYIEQEKKKAIAAHTLADYRKGEAIERKTQLHADLEYVKGIQTQELASIEQKEAEHTITALEGLRLRQNALQSADTAERALLQNAVDEAKANLKKLNEDSVSIYGKPLDVLSSQYKDASSKVTTVQGALDTAIAKSNATLTQNATAIVKSTEALRDNERAISNEIATLKAKNDATSASMVGTNSWGGFDSIADQTANAMAIQKQAHEDRLRMIDVEVEKEADKYLKNQQTLEEYLSKSGKLYDSAALERQKNEKETTKITRNSFQSQLAMVGDYAGMGAQLFSGLASAQDQSTRAGFESAKAYSMGAAIMSTAAAIIGQLSGPDSWTPIAWARAALAGVLGAIQVAQIASTSFGGGGSVNTSVPTGSFAAGGASGTGSTTGLGSSVGTSIVSIQEQQTGKQLDLIAQKIGNAALAMGKSANALFDIAGYMKNSMSGNIAGGAPGTFGTNEQSISGNHNTAVNVSAMAIGAAAGAKAGTVIGTMILPGVGTIVGAAIGVVVGTLVGWATSLFGRGPWKQEGSGFTLGVNSGDVATQGYVNMRSKGGLFQSDRTRTDYYPADDLFTQGMQNFLDKMTSSIKVGAVALGQSGEAWEKAMETVTVAPISIATAGRKAEDIQADTVAAFTKIQNTIIETTIPNIMNYALSAGETATDVYTRLASAIMNVVPQLKMVDSAIKYAGMSGAQAAYLMQDAFGGVDKMATAMDDYFTSMYTDAEQASMKAKMDKTDIESVFLAMHLAVPTTVAEFNALRSSITDPSLFVALTQIGPTFAEMTKQATEAKAALSAFSADLISRGLKLDGQTSLADLHDLKVKQENEMIDATKNGMDTQWLAIVQQKEWANAIKTASEAVDAATKKIIDSAKKALTDSISVSQNILNTLHTLLTGPAAMLSPADAYRQAKASFDSADASTISAASTAFLDASKNNSPNAAAYQADYQTVIARLAAMAETAPTISYVEQQITLLGQISKAITDGDTAMAAALQITYNAAQIDMGTAKNSLTIALEGIQEALNTTITAGTSKADIQNEIDALQLKLNLGVTGSAKDSIDTAIGALQLAMNGTISATTAQQSISDSYDIVQAALDGTINGTTAAGWIATEKLIVQAALDSSIDGSTASLAIGIESSIAQLALSGALNGTQAKQAIDVERNIIQGTLDGTISGADARTKLLAEQKIIQDVLDGSIDGDTAANSLSLQFTLITSSLTTGLDSFVTKLGLYVQAMSDATTQAGANQTLLANQNAAIDTFSRASTAYQSSLSNLTSQYTSGSLSFEDFNTQNNAAYAPVSAAYTTATGLGITSLPAPVEGGLPDSLIDIRMKNKAANIADYAMKASIGYEGYPYVAQYDIAPLVNGKAQPNGELDLGDAIVWLRIAQGLNNWSSIGLPAFANGGITNQPSIFGEAGWEAAVPLPDGRSIPVTFSDNYHSDNSALEAKLEAVLNELKQLREESKAGDIANVQNNGKVAKILSKWDGEGTPDVRAA